jgi:hypothetical protein
MKKNVRLGIDLGVLDIPESSIVDIEDIDRFDPAPCASSPRVRRVSRCPRSG